MDLKFGRCDCLCDCILVVVGKFVFRDEVGYWFVILSFVFVWEKG